MKNANPVPSSLRVAVVASALLFSACGQAEPAGGKPAAVKEAKSVADWFTISVGGKALRMQVAVRPKELERGLMERRDLEQDDAMVFVFERPQSMSFWMRNTPTPLDIAYFSPEGALVEYYPAYPFDAEVGAVAEPAAAVCRGDEPGLVSGQRDQAGRTAGYEGVERGDDGAGF